MVVDGPVVDEVKREFVKNGALLHVVGRDGRRREGARQPAATAQSRTRRPPGDLYRAAGRHLGSSRHASPDRAAQGCRSGLSALDREALSVLSFYVVSDWREGCERCKQILRYGGMGHTMSIHSRNDDVILEFGLKKPAYRIVVNTPTTHGSIGLTTGLDPAMTLGCGGYGGNITSDNISPRHLLNIKRLAYEVTPAIVRKPGGQSADSTRARLPQPPAAPPVPAGISADVMARKIDEFLTSRGYRGGAATGPIPRPRRLAPNGLSRPHRAQTSKSRRTSYVKKTSGRHSDRVAKL